METGCTVICQDKKIRTYSFGEYIELMNHFVASGTTSGKEQTPDKYEATKMNLVRMNRWNKTIVIPDYFLKVLTDMKEAQCWTVLTEAWCGDSGQITPALAKIAEASAGKINLQFVFRDDNPELMNEHLTDGNKAIPKLFARDLRGKLLFEWGPRPAGAVRIMSEWKKNPNGRTKEQALEQLHVWYAKNKQLEVLQELYHLLSSGSVNQ